MTSAQIILVVLAAIVLLSSFIDLESVKKYLVKTGDKAKDNTPDAVPVKPKIISDPCCDGSIACVVKKWEALKDCCNNCNLKQASTKLDDVFPLLVSKEEKNV